MDNPPTSQYPGLDSIEKFLEKWIEPHGYSPAPTVMTLKIDLMQHALELLRVKHNHFENMVEFEEFICGSITADIQGLHFSSPKKTQDIDGGTKPIRLQPKLLVFLLTHHRSAYKVYDIISNYIKKIFSQLQLVDFKRTQTGVYRCFTNTRFAANTLRSYGFLKYTKEEAYKTWVLSLAGFLVAAKVLQDQSWQIPDQQKSYNHELHPDILTATFSLQTYEEFVSLLSSVCKPKKELFSTFEGVLKKAHSLFLAYLSTVHNMRLPKEDRRKKSHALISQIERLPAIEDFYTEFYNCLRGEELLSG